MNSYILEVHDPRHNVDEQCVPTTLYTVLKNQFANEKNINTVSLTYKEIKKAVDYNPNSIGKLMAKLAGKDIRLIKDLFHGVFNIDEFHLKLNSLLKRHNVILNLKTGFDSTLLKDLIQSNTYPMLLINPQYINSADYKNNPRFKVRGDPKDVFSFVAIHGYENESFCLYDCDFNFAEKEILSKNNVRCKAPYGSIKKFTQDLNNRVYWYSIKDATNKTTLLKWQN